MVINAIATLLKNNLLTSESAGATIPMVLYYDGQHKKCEAKTAEMDAVKTFL